MGYPFSFYSGTQTEGTFGSFDLGLSVSSEVAVTAANVNFEGWQLPTVFTSVTGYSFDASDVFLTGSYTTFETLSTVLVTENQVVTVPTTVTGGETIHTVFIATGNQQYVYPGQDSSKMQSMKTDVTAFGSFVHVPQGYVGPVTQTETTTSYGLQSYVTQETWLEFKKTTFVDYYNYTWSTSIAHPDPDNPGSTIAYSIGNYTVDLQTDTGSSLTDPGSWEWYSLITFTDTNNGSTYESFVYGSEQLTFPEKLVNLITMGEVDLGYAGNYSSSSFIQKIFYQSSVESIPTPDREKSLWVQQYAFGTGPFFETHSTEDSTVAVELIATGWFSEEWTSFQSVIPYDSMTKTFSDVLSPFRFGYQFLGSVEIPVQGLGNFFVSGMSCTQTITKNTPAMRVWETFITGPATATSFSIGSSYVSGLDANWEILSMQPVLLNFGLLHNDLSELEFSSGMQHPEFSYQGIFPDRVAPSYMQNGKHLTFFYESIGHTGYGTDMSSYSTIRSAVVQLGDGAASLNTYMTTKSYSQAGIIHGNCQFQGLVGFTFYKSSGTTSAWSYFPSVMETTFATDATMVAFAPIVSAISDCYFPMN